MRDTENRSIQALEEEVRALKEELEAANSANQAKEIFLSNMSHDIRTPMNAIVGMVALAKNHIDEKVRVMDALDKIETASTHLLSLINDVLDMSRINSGKMTIAEDVFSLSDLLHDVLSIIRPQMEAKQHHFSFQLGDIPEETLYGDPLRLRQIYVNIANNAVKYTRDGGRITICFSEEADDLGTALVFVCEDNGIGMSEEFLQHIFDPFERVHSSTVSKIEGTGLGMSIVHQLIRQMNGKIEISSRPEEGTTVKVRIPLRVDREPVNITELAGKQLLILESDEKRQDLYRKYLEDTGIRFTLVPDYTEAIASLTDAGYQGGHFDAVIIGTLSDSVASIYDIAEYLKKYDANLVLLLVDESDWQEIEYRANRSGIEHFIPVPFFRKTLLSGLLAALQKTSKDDGFFGTLDLTGRHILLAEDNEINREIACELIGVTGAIIDTAVNGQEAVDRFRASDEDYYQLILMDIQMPVMDGYTAVREIRASARPDASRILIYAMTANAFAEDIRKAKDAGMNGHIAKPIDINLLMQLLRQLQ